MEDLSRADVQLADRRWV